MDGARALRHRREEEIRLARRHSHPEGLEGERLGAVVVADSLPGGRGRLSMLERHRREALRDGIDVVTVARLRQR
jgi:hypothetical protein